MPTTLAELRASPHISVSQIGTFIRCPRRYALQYVERIQPAFRPVALAFGSAWHSTVGEYFLNGPPVRVLQRMFGGYLEGELGRDGPPVLFDQDEKFDDLVQLGERMVTAFVGAVRRPEKLVGIEVPFAVTLVHPDTGDEVSLRLVGAMDAIVLEETGAVVLELKTGKRRWGRDQLEFDMQITAYRLAARELVADPAVRLIVTTKSTTPRVQSEELHRGPGDERDLASTAASMLRAVTAGVDHPVRGWQCRACPVAGACR